MIRSTLATLMAGVLAGGLMAQEVPQLEDAMVIKAGTADILAKTGHAAPYFYDFDRDGRKDLIVGEFGGGKARIYLNTGSTEEPKFEDFTYLEAAGQHATVPSS